MILFSSLYLFTSYLSTSVIDKPTALYYSAPIMSKSSHESLAALRLPDIRYFLGSVAFFTMASRALAVVIGLQIYRLTHSPLALGWLGLIEAIPALSLSLFGG